MVIEVLVEIKAKQIDKTFTYSVPNNLIGEISIGKRVVVPFGKRTLEGFILNINDDGSEYDYELKDIISVVDSEAVLNNELLDLGTYMSNKTLSTLINCYQAMLPVALKAKGGTIVPKKYQIYLKMSDSPSDFVVTNDKQMLIIKLITENERYLKSECNKISPYAVGKLLSENIIYEEKEEVYRISTNSKGVPSDIILNDSQKNIVDVVNNSLRTFSPYLLHGVTGSGKTEVYMHIIESVLNKDMESIVLVPEISLTPQMVSLFKNRFGDQVAIMHSGLSNGEKYDEWRKVVKKEVSIVIGARSAIFAPFNNLGLIIIDEEHSPTYKQENTPSYSAIDIAIKRAQNHRCPLVLGSATPSIESYTRAQMGVYKLLELKTRINKNRPAITLVDMAIENKKGYNILSKLMIDKISFTLEKGEQVIILLNRRGYTTVLTCNSCGYTTKCKNCDIPLVYHKVTNNMKCHYCDYTLRKIITCPECNSESLSQYGLGTQRLEEEIKRLFPSSLPIRMDVDTTSRKGSHERILNGFRNQEFNILIGTQMISKGLDFPLVTLVGVLNGDATLNIPDFRSAERTFQLLNQISGRAGRGDLLGEVVIQSFNLDHYSINYAINNNYIDFYNKEMSIRKLLGYPPYYNLTLIKISGKDSSAVHNESFKILNYLKNSVKSDVALLGPSPSSMPKVNNIYYYQIVIKYKDTKKLIPILIDLNELYRSNNKVYMSIDINPSKI